MRLFCFSYAGGAASVYREWPALLPAFIDVCPVQLPGRENRLGEAPRSDLNALAGELDEHLSPWLDKPYAFFGHSLGALIAFELARTMRRRGGAAPRHLFASARRAPHFRPQEPFMHTQPQDELVRRLRVYDGTPEEILANREFMAVFAPVIRADFALYERHTYVEEPPLACDLTVFGGTDDGESSDDRLEAWRSHAAGAFRLRLFPGGHFFLNEPDTRAELLADIASVLGGDRAGGRTS